MDLLAQVECRHNAVQNTTLCHAALHWPKQSIIQRLNSQNKLHASPSYRIPIARIWEKTDRVMTAPHCTLNGLVERFFLKPLSGSQLGDEWNAFIDNKSGVYSVFQNLVHSASRYRTQFDTSYLECVSKTVSHRSVETDPTAQLKRIIAVQVTGLFLDIDPLPCLAEVTGWNEETCLNKVECLRLALWIVYVFPECEVSPMMLLFGGTEIGRVGEKLCLKITHV